MSDSIRAGFHIAADHPSLAGHFPGNPVVPGVVLLEQVLLSVQAAWGLEVEPLSLPQVKFLQPLLPEQAATIELERTADRVRFRILRGEQLLASGEMGVG